MGLTIKENILTNNDCYKSGRTITPIGMQLHTIGTGQNTASSLSSKSLIVFVFIFTSSCN